MQTDPALFATSLAISTDEVFGGINGNKKGRHSAGLLFKKCYEKN